MSNVTSLMASVDEAVSSVTACPCCGGTDSSLWMRTPDQYYGGDDIYDLLYCAACRHVWLSNPPGPEELGYYYSTAYHQAVGTSGETSPRRWQRVLNAISSFRSSGSILDIGCSSGGFLAHLKSGPWKLYGIEADEATAERARALTCGEIFSGDVGEADYPSCTFDVVTCSDVLEHLYEPRAVLSKVFEWLKPGGVFYVFVPNIMSWEARAFGRYWYGLDLPRHLHHFSKDSLASLAKSIGLRQLRMVTPPGSYVEHSASVVYTHWLNNRDGGKRSFVDLSIGGALPLRAVRKALRLTAEASYSGMAAVCGAGPSIQAVFQKSSDIQN